jgi:hypothetical protein
VKIVLRVGIVLLAALIVSAGLYYAVGGFASSSAGELSPDFQQAAAQTTAPATLDAADDSATGDLAAMPLRPMQGEGGPHEGGGLGAAGDIAKNLVIMSAICALVVALSLVYDRFCGRRRRTVEAAM